VLRENIKYACFGVYFDYFRAGLKKWIWSKIRVDFTQHRQRFFRRYLLCIVTFEEHQSTYDQKTQERSFIHNHT
jgi:hypothetical protein